MSSSGSVVLNENFTSGTEIIVNQTAGSDLGYDVSAAFGSGSVTAPGGTDWWRTSFSNGGWSFFIQSYPHFTYLLPNTNLADDTVEFTDYLVNPATYTNAATPHTFAYGYDPAGNAYMDILNTKGNHQGVNIPDPYGYGQYVHPSVIYNETGIFGHKYWMLITPYAGNDPAYENPCLYYSDDGIDWHVPPGITNPIDDMPSDGWGSDTEIVYNPQTGKLYCYYVDYNNSIYQGFVHLRTYDGSSVSSEININGPEGASPAVIYDSGTFTMWIVNYENYPYTIDRATSTDGINWNYAGKTTYGSQFESIWHLDTIKSQDSSKIYGILTSTGPIKGVDTTYGLQLQTVLQIISLYSRLLFLSVGNTVDLGVNGDYYRCTGTFVGSNDNDGMKIWYSAWNTPWDQKGLINYRNGGWFTAYTQIAPGSNGKWAVVDYSIPPRTFNELSYPRIPNWSKAMDAISRREHDFSWWEPNH